jgi:hypothetical protein
VRPSPLLCCHPGHCSTIPGAVGAWDNKTPPRPLLYDRWPFVSRTLESAYGQRSNEKLPHGHPQTRSGADTGLTTTHGRGEIRPDDLLGNSGKTVTLETSRLMKFVMGVFRGKELTKIWSLELTKSRSRERAMARNLEPAKP